MTKAAREQLIADVCAVAQRIKGEFPAVAAWMQAMLHHTIVETKQKRKREMEVMDAHSGRKFKVDAAKVKEQLKKEKGGGENGSQV